MSNKLEAGVIGLGKFGHEFGKTLMELGQQVVGIDQDLEQVRMARDDFTQVYQADATNKEALAQMGVPHLTHVLVSVGDSIAASAMIVMYLKELGVPRVLAKAINLDHQKLLHKVGVDEVIIPEHLAARQMATRIAVPGFIENLPFARRMVVKELPVEQWAGKSLREIDLTNRYSIQVIAIKRHNEQSYRFIPKADDILAAGDTLVVIGDIAQLNQISES